jgi:hypothetical protein
MRRPAEETTCMRHTLTLTICLLGGGFLIAPCAHADQHADDPDDAAEVREHDGKPPLSEAIPDNTADGFGVEDLNEDELGADIGAVRKVVMIDGSAAADPVRYELAVTGEIQKAEGDIEGFPATISDEPGIDGEIAKGWIRSTIDTYYVYGEIRHIALADPAAASVYVDGEPVETRKLAD